MLFSCATDRLNVVSRKTRICARFRRFPLIKHRYRTKTGDGPMFGGTGRAVCRRVRWSNDCDDNWSPAINTPQGTAEIQPRPPRSSNVHYEKNGVVGGLSDVKQSKFAYAPSNRLTGARTGDVEWNERIRFNRKRYEQIVILTVDACTPKKGGLSGINNRKLIETNEFSNTKRIFD